MAEDFDNVTEEQFTSTKSFYNFPCAHRQYRHDGNCHVIHGYSRSFHFVFGIKSFTKEGFAVDYGDLKELKAHLEHMYDHTLVLDEDDPYMDKFRELEKAGVCRIELIQWDLVWKVLHIIFVIGLINGYVKKQEDVPGLLV